MLCIRLVILSLLTACAVSFATTATAMASPEFIVEGEAVKTAKSVEGTSGVSKLATEIGSTKITIACNKDKASGAIEAEGKSSVTITFEECRVEGASGCTVANTTGKSLGRLIEKGGNIEDELYEEGAGPFATVKITGCALNGTFQVKGTQICELPGGPEVLITHEVACKSAGSNLKFGTKAATLESTEKVKLDSGEVWGIEPIRIPTLELPAAELDFTLNANGEKKEFTIKNLGLVIAFLKTEWIEEGGGLPQEGNFKIVPAAVEPCNKPTVEPFEKLRPGEKCKVGVEVKAKGQKANYVLKYNCWAGYLLCGNEDKSVKMKS
jgi:hypothetical protein